MGVKISDLANKAVLAGTEQLEINDAGTSKRTTAAAIAALATFSGDAEDVAYDNGSSGLSAEDVQAAIDELAGSVGGGTPGGSDTQVQFNDGGAFGGEAEFAYDKTNNILSVRRIHAGAVNGDDNGISGDDPHWLNISNDPAVVAGGASAGFQLLRVNSYAQGGYGGNIHFCRYRGSKASPSAVQSTDIFSSFGWRGWDSSSVLSQSAAAWQVIATENWTNIAHGLKMRWEMTPNGSVTRALAMELNGSGKLTPNALACLFGTLTDGANISVNAIGTNNFRVTLGGNRTLDNPTNLSDGQVLNFRIAQDATGNRTLSYGNKFKWPGGSPPTLSTAGNAVDMISCIYDSSSDTLMCAIQKAFA